MLNKCKIIVLLLLVVMFSGCSCSKEQLKEENATLLEENRKLSEAIDNYREIKEIFDFYNSITMDNISSFVVVESKNSITSLTRYSNGVVLGSVGLKYYILSDYNAISQEGIVSYRVMDKNANVYRASIAYNNDSVFEDEFSGLVLLEVNVGSYSNIVINSIELGDKTDLIASFSSVSQLNRVQILDNIKTSTISYNDTSYDTYYLEGTTIESGTILINENNELFAMYMSKLETFISVDLIKELVYSTYSLIL